MKKSSIIWLWALVLGLSACSQKVAPPAPTTGEMRVVDPNSNTKKEQSDEF